MSNVTRAIDAFLEHFNYVERTGPNQGKRKGYTPRFFNKPLTGVLEKIANLLIKDLTTLRNSETTKTKLFEFRTLLENAVKNAWTNRDLASRKIKANQLIYFHPMSTLPPSMVKTSLTHTPYAAGQFEANIISGVIAAMEQLNAHDAKILNPLLTQVRNYQPYTHETEVHIRQL